MTDYHPITPPPELRQKWREQAPRYRDGGVSREHWLMERAAQWGADQELEACCDWMSECTVGCPNELRAVRRPKPPSLKEQALKTLEEAPGPDYPRAMTVLDSEQHALIRRALEAL